MRVSVEQVLRVGPKMADALRAAKAMFHDASCWYYVRGKATRKIRRMLREAS